jgi:hypothetical protein
MVIRAAFIVNLCIRYKPWKGKNVIGSVNIENFQERDNEIFKKCQEIPRNMSLALTIFVEFVASIDNFVATHTPSSSQSGRQEGTMRSAADSI